MTKIAGKFGLTFANSENLDEGVSSGFSLFSFCFIPNISILKKTMSLTTVTLIFFHVEILGMKQKLSKQ